MWLVVEGGEGELLVAEAVAERLLRDLDRYRANPATAPRAPHATALGRGMAAGISPAWPWANPR
jgi:hypothetical protein